MSQERCGEQEEDQQAQRCEHAAPEYAQVRRDEFGPSGGTNAGVLFAVMVGEEV